MKRRIRKGVFETNSSSVHSLVFHAHAENEQYNDAFADLKTLIDPDDNKIHITPDEFGWGYHGSYEGAAKKLSYLATIITEKYYTWYDEDTQNIEEDIISDYDFERVNDILRTNLVCDGWIIDPLGGYYKWGYIDHQSRPENIITFLDWNDCDSIEEFLFDDNVELIIDNDNH